MENENKTVRGLREAVAFTEGMRVIYRIAQNERNIKDPPWDEAIGIEAVELWPDGSEVLAVPSLVCWLTRGGDAQALAERIVRLLNFTPVVCP